MHLILREFVNSLDKKNRFPVISLLMQSNSYPNIFCADHDLESLNIAKKSGLHEYPGKLFKVRSDSNDFLWRLDKSIAYPKTNFLNNIRSMVCFNSKKIYKESELRQYSYHRMPWVSLLYS